MGSISTTGNLIRRIPGAARSAWGRLLEVGGVRGHLTRALVASVALAVVAGSTAGAVTLVAQTVSLSGSASDAAATDDGTEGEDGGVSDANGSTEDATDDAGVTPAPDDADGDDTADGTEDDAEDATEGGTAEGSSEGKSDVPLTFAQTVARHGAPDYAAILTRRYPGAQWSLNGNDPSGLVWIGPGGRPAPEELDAHWPSVAAELAAERAAQEAAEAEATAAREAELEARRADPDIQALLDSFDPRIIWGSTPDYAAILTRRFPGAQWSLNGNDPAGGLVWHDGGTKPTKAQLDAMWADVAREMALEMDRKELERWAGTGDQIYVDGVLRPKGWVGGANDPQPGPVEVTEDNWRYLPQLPNDGGGGSIEIYKDPTGAKNFEQLYGIDLGRLVRLISEAHGNWGNQYGGLGLSLSGDRTLLWYSSQVDRSIVVSVLTSLGALPADRSTPAPAEPEPDPEPEPEPEPEPDPEPEPEPEPEPDPEPAEESDTDTDDGTDADDEAPEATEDDATED